MGEGVLCVFINVRFISLPAPGTPAGLLPRPGLLAASSFTSSSSYLSRLRATQAGPTSRASPTTPLSKRKSNSFFPGAPLPQSLSLSLS